MVPLNPAAADLAERGRRAEEIVKGNPSPVEPYRDFEVEVARATARYDGVRYDVEVDADRDGATRAVRELTRMRTALEKKRKEIKAPALRYCEQIDSEAKRITALIADIENPIKALLEARERRIAEETAARERAAAARRTNFEASIASIRNHPAVFHSATAEEIREAIANVASIDVATFEEFAAAAAAARQQTLAALIEMENRASAAKAAAQAAAKIEAARREENRVSAQRIRIAGMREVPMSVMMESPPMHAGDIARIIEALREGHGWPPRGAFDPDFADEAARTTADVIAALERLQAAAPRDAPAAAEDPQTPPRPPVETAIAMADAPSRQAPTLTPSLAPRIPDHRYFNAAHIVDCIRNYTDGFAAFSRAEVAEQFNRFWMPRP